MEIHVCRSSLVIINVLYAEPIVLLKARRDVRNLSFLMMEIK